MNQTLRHLAEALAPSLGRRPHGRALTPTTAHTVLPTVSHACGLSPTAPAHVLAGHFIDAGLPEWWGAGTPGMYNATTSTNASHADPQGRLHRHRQPAASPALPRSHAGVRRPCAATSKHAAASRSAPRSWPASSPPPPSLSAACSTRQGSPRHPARCPPPTRDAAAPTSTSLP